MYVNSFQCQMREWASTLCQTPQTFIMRSGRLGKLVLQLATLAQFRLRLKYHVENSRKVRSCGCNLQYTVKPLCKMLNKLCKVLHNPCETDEPTNSCVKSYTTIVAQYFNQQLCNVFAQ